MKENQFSLLKKRRFGPLFTTQFLGAFNDNIYKNALIILLTFHTAMYTTMSVSTLVNLAGGLFIFPFFIFSATFGQIADKFEKSRLIRYTKILEIVIASLAVIGFYSHSLFVLLLALFLLGTQAALFGPVKYSIIPQHVKSYELIGANGLVEMGTFVAILIGTIIGGILISMPHFNTLAISLTVVLVALLGYVASRYIPKAKAADPHLKISWNIFTQTWRNIQFARKNRVVFLSILGLSWFWFFGSFMLYQAPKYAKVYLGGNEHIATLILATFSVGIGVGALLTEKLSRRAIEIGLVPIAAIGLSIFTADLYHLQSAVSTISNQNLHQFFLLSNHRWIVFDLFMIGVCSGLYTVPLYALIQDRSAAAHRSRIIAAANIINALFMVASAVFAIILLKLGLSIPQLFLTLALFNICITMYIFFLIPEFILRLSVWVIANLMYRITIKGIENLPRKGGIIYACNHVSFVDVLILAGVSSRPIRFLMDKRLFDTPFLHRLSKIGRAIPIATSKECEDTKNEAFEKADKALKRGEVIGIFPEGSITRNGKIGAFKRGTEELIRREAVPVVPMAIHGLWGSYFSRQRGKAMKGLPKRFRSKVILNIGEPIPPSELTTKRLQQEIERLYKEID